MGKGLSNSSHIKLGGSTDPRNTESDARGLVGQRDIPDRTILDGKRRNRPSKPDVPHVDEDHREEGVTERSMSTHLRTVHRK
jgi:hypothetical protein